MTDDDSDVLDWTHTLRSLGERGVEVDRQATEAERTAIAAALDLESCPSLAVRYRLRPLSRGRVRLKGHIDAEIVQRCVISLAPVPATIAIDLDAEFWPADEVQAGGDFDAMGPSDPEPYEGETLRMGRLVYEELAAAIDPYPRAPGAEVTAPKDDIPASDSPFAALARLKRQE